MIRDPAAQLAFLAAIAALVFQANRSLALQRVFDKLPALVWAYFIPMLATAAGLLPAESRQACTGGLSSAPLVADAYQRGAAPVGLLLAVVGNVAGTYAGLLVAQALKAL